MIGQNGADTYQFRERDGAADGTDTIIDRQPPANIANAIDTLQLFATTIDELVLKRGGEHLSDLIIEFAGSDDKVIVVDQFERGTAEAVLSKQKFGIEQVQFVDASTGHVNATIALSDLIAQIGVTDDASGGNVLTTNDDGGTLDGGAGNDTLMGGGGDDAYLFASSFDDDVVEDAGGANDMLSLTDVSFAEVMFSRSGDDLVIEVGGEQRRAMTVKGQFSDDGTRIEVFKFADGIEVTWEQAQDIILANARTGGADTITGFSGDDELNGAAGADTLTGGAGHDTFAGKPADLDGDVFTDFSAGDRIRVEGVRLVPEAVNITEGPTILDIDTDSDGKADTRIRLSGTFDGAFQTTSSGPEEDAFTVIQFVPNSDRRRLCDGRGYAAGRRGGGSSGQR